MLCTLKMYQTRQTKDYKEIWVGVEATIPKTSVDKAFGLISTNFDQSFLV